MKIFKQHMEITKLKQEVGNLNQDIGNLQQEKTNLENENKMMMEQIMEQETLLEFYKDDKRITMILEKLRSEMNRKMQEMRDKSHSDSGDADPLSVSDIFNHALDQIAHFEQSLLTCPESPTIKKVIADDKTPKIQAYTN